MKKIIGYENYTISDDGVVENQKGLKKSSFNNNGYRSISLYKNGKQKVFFVHRLVAIHYIPNPENKPCVNHKDFNRANNNKSNLEWCTPKENEAHKHNFKLKKDNDPSVYHEQILLRYKKTPIQELAKEIGVYESVLSEYMLKQGLFFFKGFSYEPSRRKFKATIWENGKHRLIGRFNTEEEARSAYIEYKKQIKSKQQ